MMMAVLPRQNADERAGELFVAAYEMHLAEHPKAAIDYLTRRATGECHWFPTPARCKEILADYRRDDEAMRIRREASSAANREKYIRRSPAPPEVAPWKPKPGELERIKAEVAAKFPTNRTETLD